MNVAAQTLLLKAYTYWPNCRTVRTSLFRNSTRPGNEIRRPWMRCFSKRRFALPGRKAEAVQASRQLRERADLLPLRAMAGTIDCLTTLAAAWPQTIC
jgi:hypothetical protein